MGGIEIRMTGQGAGGKREAERSKEKQREAERSKNTWKVREAERSKVMRREAAVSEREGKGSRET